MILATALLLATGSAAAQVIEAPPPWFSCYTRCIASIGVPEPAPVDCEVFGISEDEPHCMWLNDDEGNSGEAVRRFKTCNELCRAEVERGR